MKVNPGWLLIYALMPINAYGQHDDGRNAVRLLAAGQTDAAIEMMTPPFRRKDRSIGAAERYLVLAMAACEQGDATAAFGHAKKAVDNGLPPERLQAGPRELFNPLYEHGPFNEWMEDKNKQLLHGPMLGSLTDASASFWVRTEEEADVKIVVQPVLENAVGNAPALTRESRTSSPLDYTAVIEVSGLSPDTRYRFEVLVNGERAGTSAEFRTYPKQDSPARFRVVFGGGAGFTPENERMWTTIGKHTPLAMFLLGDNVYIDDPEHLLTQRYCYYRRQSQADWRRLAASTSVYSIYDDHDFGDNDCVPGPEIEKPKWKRDVWNTFQQNWNNPSYGGGENQPGCWCSFYIGDVHFIMLDGRYYRDLKSGTMLGPVQKAWLFKTLKASTGRFKVLASPVPWSRGVKPGSKDPWDGFPAEREEIFAFIEKQRIEGVLLMAADRHRSDLRKTRRAGAYDLYEVMSSRLTNNHTHRLMERAKGSEFIMGYSAKCSFGLLDFDTTADDPQVKYSIVNIDGKVIDSRTLKSSELTPSDEDR
jgi:alkaline phosphatase D